MAKLVVYNNDGRRDIELEAVNSIGRMKDCRVHIDDPLISKSHCTIFMDQNGRCRIADPGSRNGTYVNNQRVLGESSLEDGDEITMGMTSCLFVSDELQGHSVSIEDDPSNIVAVDAHAGSPTKFLAENQIQSEKTLRADYEKLRVAIELQRDIGLELNLNRIFNRIIASTFEFLDCDKVAILMINESGELKVQASRTRRKTDRLIISSTIVQRIQEDRVGIISADALADERFMGAKSILSQDIRSSMAVPILLEEKLLGIIIIESSSAIKAYTEQDLHFFTNIAHQTAQLIKISEMARRIEEEAITRERFQRLLSPDLAAMVVSGKLKVEKGGEIRAATVLFADIRGFTSLCENMQAADVLHMLNEYFEILVDVAFQYEGTVDKFIGDMIMLIWGAPVDHSDDPVRAVRAALDMQIALAEYNEKRRAKNESEIRIGIGINTGELVAGYIGSSQTMSYSVVGDAVNVASRLCSVASAGQVLISESTYLQVREHFTATPLDPVIVKGRSKPLQVYSVIASSKTF